MITIEEVDRLRAEWVALQEKAIEAANSFAYSAGTLALDNNSVGAPSAADEYRAAIVAADAAQRAKWLEYQDALTLLQAQQAAGQVAASNSLAAWNRNLAIVIAVATAAQAYYACRTFYKPEASQCPSEKTGTK